MAFAQLADRAVLRVLAKSVGVTLALFGVLGAGLYFALAGLAARVGVDAGWAGVLAVLLVPVAIWLLFRIVAVAVLQFFADAVVAAVEARHYPALAQTARPLPFRRELANAAKGLLRTLGYNLVALPLAGLLAFTAIGPAVLLFTINAGLLGRELTEMAWLRHCRGAEHANPSSRAERFLLGAAIAALMLVPVAGLLGPVVGAAAGTHLVLRRMAA